MAIGNLVTTDEVAKIIGVTPARVRQFVTSGRIEPDEKIGNANLFNIEKVREFSKKTRKNGRPKKIS